jgi:exodeoxyribonuclease VII large subunit
MAVPVRAELAASVRELASRHELAVRRFMEAERRHYVTLCRALPSLADIVSLPRQRLDDVGGRLGRSLGTEVAKKRRDYAIAQARLSPQLLERAQAVRRERITAAMQRLSNAQRACVREIRRDMSRTGDRLNIACVARMVQRHRDHYGQVCRILDAASPLAILAKGYAVVFDLSGRTVRSPEAVQPGQSLRIRTAGGDLAARVESLAPPQARLAPKPARRRTTPSQESLF